jgi:hypothetical protein
MKIQPIHRFKPPEQAAIGIGRFRFWIDQVAASAAAVTHFQASVDIGERKLETKVCFINLAGRWRA